SARRDPQQASGVRVPDVQPAVAPQRGRERRATSRLRGRSSRSPRARARCARTGRPRRSREAPSERALRRPAAARRDRACSAQRPIDDPRGRADREPRFALERGDPGDPPATQRAGEDRRHGHARTGCRGALPPHRAHAGRRRLARRSRRRAAPRRGRDRVRDRRDGMKLYDSFRSALQSLVVNKLRSSLTMLGVIIGVASVIAMVAVGNGASQQVQNTILSLGSNLITVSPANLSDQGLRGAGAQSQNLTLDDMRAIQTQLGSSIAASEAEQGAGRWQVTAAGQNWNTNVNGVTEDYPIVRDWPLQSGDFFSGSDVTVNAQVAVIGSTTATSLFGENDAVGQTLQLRQVFGGGGQGQGQQRARIVNFKVVGVLEPKGSTFGFGRDDQILVPVTTAQRVLTGRLNVVNTIVVKATSSDAMTDTTADVTNVLLQRHNISDPTVADFTVTNQNDTLAALGAVTGTFTLLLGAIGGISLLVGGIGIMNIMLVSVNERTREIGIRKAVGARRQDIMVQFLIESMALTGIGGILGILLGWSITLVVALIPQASGLVLVITTGTVIIAVGVSVAIGVVFGLYPAMRAARLHPIQALRYE